ncbi:hypothetical protein CCX46_27525 [Pseudomonas sp. RU47]|nr:hypothetical protein CCX46_27525 [Pseudomonas sp. RU47]
MISSFARQAKSVVTNVSLLAAYALLKRLIVPTLCVVTPPGTLRVPVTQSVTGCMPTQSVGTIKRATV